MLFGHRNSNEDNPATMEEAPPIAGSNGYAGQPSEFDSPQDAAAPAAGDTYFIIQQTPEGPMIYRSDSGTEARVFLEALIGEGAAQENLLLFHATQVSFEVRFQPIVSFDAL